MCRSLLVSVSALEELELLFNVTEWDCRSTSDSLIGVDVVSNLGSVSLVSVSLNSSTANTRTGADDFKMDGASHTVIVLDIDLGQVEVLLFVGGALPDIPPGGTVDNLSHLETLDSLILGHYTRTVHASDGVRVSLILLSSSVVPSL